MRRSIEHMEYVQYSGRKWQDNVKRKVFVASSTAYYEANTTKAGKLRRNHKPYTLPKWVDDLIDCLNTDNEVKAKTILAYEFLRDY